MVTRQAPVDLFFLPTLDNLALVFRQPTAEMFFDLILRGLNNGLHITVEIRKAKNVFTIS